MPVNGKIGEINIKEVQVVADVEHKPVILTKNLKTGQGVLEAGSIIGKDLSTGDLVFYDPTAVDGSGNPTQEPIGVLANLVDTDRQTLANIVVHGVVLQKFLQVKAGTINSDVLNALEVKTIWAI
ncbi:head decoration protein [Persephonella sp.]